jgi:hypothetical protein
LQSALAVSAFHQLSLPRGRADLRSAHEQHFSAGHAFRCQSAHRTARRKPSGNEVPGERTLGYFIAHEVTHTLIADRLGVIAYWRLPVWKEKVTPTTSARGRRSTIPRPCADCGAETLKWIPSDRGCTWAITCRRLTWSTNRGSAWMSFCSGLSMWMS